MWNSLIMALKYVRYFVMAQTKHDIHSPFVFKLVTEVINNHKKDPAYNSVERLRKSMLQNHEQIDVRDYGAGFSGIRYKKRQIDFITRNSAKSPRYCRLLNRLVAFLDPEVILEMGTSVGISSMYMAMAAPTARLITMEGCENTALLARGNFRKLSLTHIEQVIGDFENTLPALLGDSIALNFVFLDGNHQRDAVLFYFNSCLARSSNQTCFVIDDINWSEGMKDAWKSIKQNPKVTVTIDLFMMGLVFINPEFTRQDFTIRF